MQEHGDRLLKAPAKGVSSVEADQGEVGTILVVISLEKLHLNRFDKHPATFTLALPLSMVPDGVTVVETCCR